MGHCVGDTHIIDAPSIGESFIREIPLLINGMKNEFKRLDTLTIE